MAYAGWTPSFILSRAASIAGGYDQQAKSDVLHNRTSGFHLCGLIERAASTPKSGSAYRRSIDGSYIDQAKAAFCHVHAVVHPQLWEDEKRPNIEQVRHALASAAGAGE